MIDNAELAHTIATSALNALAKGETQIDLDLSVEGGSGEIFGDDVKALFGGIPQRFEFGLSDADPATTKIMRGYVLSLVSDELDKADWKVVELGRDDTAPAILNLSVSAAPMQGFDSWQNLTLKLGLSEKTKNEKIAEQLIGLARVNLGDGTWTPNEALEFDFPYDGALTKGGSPDTLNAQLAATDLIDKAFRRIGWHPVNLPWDEDGVAVIEPINDELQAIFIEVNFTVTGAGRVQQVCRDWLLFNEDWEETAYRAVM